MEERIREIGGELFSSLERETPSLFDQRRWIGRITRWAMKDEAFKTQLFRFIDVLPALKSDELVVRVFREYFEGFEDAPFLIRQGLKRIFSRFPSASASLIRLAVGSLARQFIAGNDPRDALPYLKSLVEDGAALSIDLLGEAVLSDAEAARYRARYLELLDFLQPHFGRADISLKVTSFYSQLEPLNREGSIEETRESLIPVFEKARSLGASVTFDMEHYYLKDLTLAIFRSTLDELRDFPGAGIAMQAYLRDTREDLEELIRWAKEKGQRIAVRLVKGAYWDYETVINRLNGWPVPVFLDKGETDRNFEELTIMLMENSEHVYPAIASHNIRSISSAIAHAERLGLREDTFEFQTLYGMGEPIRRALKSTPYRVRVYSPIGELLPGMAYLVRRLLENTSNESFLRRSFAEEASFEDVMMAPAPSGETAEQEPEGFRNEPPADFSRAENREKMNEALLSVRRNLGQSLPLLIGGEKVSTENQMPSLNPAKPEEMIGRVSQASTAEVERAIQEARRAWGTWRHAPADERAGYLFQAAEEMRKRRFDLAALEVYEVGKPIFEADGDVAEAIDYLEYYGREMLRLAPPRRLSRLEGEEDTYLYEPKGVGVVISPWNFPLAIPTGMTAAAIVTGNCVVLKPSGLSPVTAWQLVDIFRTVGLQQGVLQYLPGPGGVVGEYLVSHPEVDFIAFTGSMDVGLGIVRLASDTRTGQRSVKRVVAEMGGKNAVIVDETADLDEAVKGVLESALGYQGQKCSACSRVIVVGERFDEFLGRLPEAMKSIAIGPPEDPATFMGPLVDAEALRKVQRYVEAGRREGRHVLHREVREDGYYASPGIFDVAPDASVAREEIFGPVLSAHRAADMDEAIAMANDSPYALTGGLFSRSPRNIARAKAELRAGNLYINRKITGALVGRQPFGGFGMSGVGSKAGGPDYLLQFMNPRTITENTLRRGFAPPTEE